MEQEYIKYSENPAVEKLWMIGAFPVHLLT